MTTDCIICKWLYSIILITAILLLNIYSSTAQCIVGYPFLDEEVVIKNNFRSIGSDALGALNQWSHESYYLNDINDARTFNLNSFASLVVASLDTEGNLSVAANTFLGSKNYDFIPGPISVNSPNTSDLSEAYTRIWKIAATEIEEHKNKVFFGLQLLDNVPIDILEWPAKGNPYLGEFAPIDEMAPYYDSDNDGTYDPLKGDYPIVLIENPDFIPAEFSFNVYNDCTTHTNTFGDPVIIEIHQLNYLVRSFESTLASHSIFTRLKYIYKGTEELDEFKLGIWEDNQLGYFYDDAPGIDTVCNSTYLYNIDGIDEENPLVTEFISDSLGAIRGKLYLTNDIMSFMYYNFIPGTDLNHPNSPEDYYNSLSSKWNEGTPLTHGGLGYDPSSTDYTKFAFPSVPTETNGWSVQNLSIFPENGNGFRTITTLIDQPLSPGDSGTIDYIDYLIYDGETKGFDIFDKYPSAMAELKDYYNKLLTNQISSIDNQVHDDLVIKLFPNPVKNRLHIQFPNRIEGRIDVIDAHGKLVITKSISDLQAYSLSTSSLLAGYYLVKISTSGGSVTSSSFIKQ